MKGRGANCCAALNRALRSTVLPQAMMNCRGFFGLTPPTHADRHLPGSMGPWPGGGSNG
jgi:hypothetical protein